MKLDPRSVERITKEFSSGDRSAVAELLISYSGPEEARVIWDILGLSGGSAEKVRRYVEAAKMDYRDILYWAEYYQDDPMFRGRDRMKLTDDLIAKWGVRPSTTE